MALKFFVIARHGLGDVLNGIFISERGRKTMSRLWSAVEEGAVDDCVLLYEEHYNPHTPELFTDMPFDIRIEPTRLLGENLGLNNLVACGNNYMPDSVGDHLNIWTQGHLLEEFDDTRSISVATTAPSADIPEKYILFCPYASNIDRQITHANVIKGIRMNTDLPIVSVGRAPGGAEPPPELRGDIDLINKTSITETLHLAKHAECVVGAASWYRCFNTLFDVPVIEVYEAFRAPSDLALQTISRTLGEMGVGLYGIKHNLHCFLLLGGPQPSYGISTALERYLDTSDFTGGGNP